MKLISFLAIFFLCIQISLSQDEFLRKDDSLHQLLNQNISDSFRVKILEELHFLWKSKSFIRSLEYSRQSIALSEKFKPAIYTQGLRFQLGYAYMEVGDAVRSLEIFHQLLNELEMASASGISPDWNARYSLTLSFIAMNYEKQGDIKKALEYQLKSNTYYDKLDLTDSNTDRRGYLGIPQTTAAYYLKNNQLDSALLYAELAFSRLKTEPLHEFNRFFSWYIKTTLGDIYSRLKEYDKALSFYTDAEREAKTFHSNTSLVTIYLARAKIYYDQKKNTKAQEYAYKCYVLADTLKLLPGVKESATLLKTIYIEQHKTDSALIYYDIAMAAKDSMFNADVARKIDAMEFSEEKRAQELKALQQDKLYQKKQFYLLTGILLSIILAAFFYYKNRLKQKANQLLEYENREIFLQRNQLQRDLESFEMQALKAQLNPHFIFNCLNSIDAFIYSNDKYKATMYLNKFAKLLRNILDSSKNNTVSLLKDIQSLQLYTDLEELRNDHKFRSEFQIDESLTDSKYTVPPLIIQPLVENAILHGLKNRPDKEGKLTISISSEGERLKYKITDNGIGRKSAMMIPKYSSHSYGMELTKSRIKVFNKEETPSLIIEDLYEGDTSQGTCAIVYLNKIIT